MAGGAGMAVGGVAGMAGAGGGATAAGTAVGITATTVRYCRIKKTKARRPSCAGNSIFTENGFAIMHAMRTWFGSATSVTAHV